MAFYVLLFLAVDFAALLLIFHLFFSPFRLGPAPRIILSESFFSQPGEMPDISLYIDGKEAFGAIFEAIGRASESVHVQTFIWKDDSLGARMVDAALGAADRGAKVVLSKDVLGTFFEIAGKDRKLSPIFKDKDLNRLPNVTIDLGALKPVDHSKFYIIDNKEVIFGGMNVADEYHDDWHDYMIGLRDEKIAGWFASKVISGTPWPDEAPFVITNNTKKAAEVRTGMAQVIDSARERLLFEHAYFSADIILEAIERALARGVKVDLILPEAPSTHGPANRASVNRLLASRHSDALRVFFYPTMTHAKALVVDGMIVAIGSANMTPRSLYVSGETVMFAHFPPDHPFISRLNARLEEDMAQAKRINEPFNLSLAERARAFAGKYIW